LKIHVLIKLGVCVESELHMKNTKLEDWCSQYKLYSIVYMSRVGLAYFNLFSRFLTS